MMILVTVGAQMPFDRLVQAVDQWAGRNPEAKVFAQIGLSELRPTHMKWTKFVAPQEFRALIGKASVIVSHAGIGTILTALEFGKPIIVMPRRGSLLETRNDHQVATAMRFRELKRVEVAFDEHEISAKLDLAQGFQASARISAHASPELLECIREFVGRVLLLEESLENGVVRRGRMLGREQEDGRLEAFAQQEMANAWQGGKAIAFDGIICFGGEDWWYHNRGHYDMQVMRQLGRKMPVLYCNSLGMRMPPIREGRVFVRRILRKLWSFLRGLRRVDRRFAVMSPFTVPRLQGWRPAVKLVAWQAKRAARRIGIKAPLVWVACPPAADVIRELSSVGVVYQRTDRYECFPYVNAGRIGAYDEALKQSADLTVFCSALLFEEEKQACRRAALVDHGVDFELFSEAGIVDKEPEDLKQIPRPRAGFVGGVDTHTFDAKLFAEVAAVLPEVSFVVVGACSLPPGWCLLPNVYLLGQRTYEQVPAYMAACNVLIMPWKQNKWIEACNPVKLKEYLAVGRPIVSTAFEELKKYEGFVSIAHNASEFSDALKRALHAPPNFQSLRERVREETWAQKAARVIEELKQLGLCPLSNGPLP